MEDDDRWDGVNAPDGLGFQHRWDGVLASAKDWMIVDSVQQAVFFFLWVIPRVVLTQEGCAFEATSVEIITGHAEMN